MPYVLRPSSLVYRAVARGIPPRSLAHKDDIEVHTKFVLTYTIWNENTKFLRSFVNVNVVNSDDVVSESCKEFLSVSTPSQ